MVDGKDGVPQSVKHIPELQRRNYQVRKEIVHELEFGDIAAMQI